MFSKASLLFLMKTLLNHFITGMKCVSVLCSSFVIYAEDADNCRDNELPIIHSFNISIILDALIRLESALCYY